MQARLSQTATRNNHIFFLTIFCRFTFQIFYPNRMIDHLFIIQFNGLINILQNSTLLHIRSCLAQLDQVSSEVKDSEYFLLEGAATTAKEKKQPNQPKHKKQKHTNVTVNHCVTNHQCVVAQSSEYRRGHEKTTILQFSF